MSNISITPDSTMESVGVTAQNMKKQTLEALKMATIEEEELYIAIIEGNNKQLESNFPPQASYSLEEAVMMAIDSTVEDQLANLTKLTEEEGRTATKGIQVSSDGLIQIDQLREFIKGTIKSKFDGSSKSSSTYSKPYTQRIDNLKMPLGYQPPKFTQFDGKGNPKQHVAHFVETCNNAGTFGDYLVKQFVRSLKGNAFDWYTDLEPNWIDSWGQLENEFLNRFYSTRRTVSMVELTNTRQWEEEPVIDYINRWRNLCLNCKDRLSETSAIEIAHDMELSMTASRVKGPPIQEPHEFKEREEFKNEGKSFDMTLNEESMAVKAVPVKFLRKDAGKNVPQEREQRKLTLREMQQREYPFLDSDVPGIFEDLCKTELIKLPEMKRPEEAGRTDDPKYCKYHRLVGHSIQNCFIFKDKVMQLAQQGKISLEEVLSSNLSSSFKLIQASSIFKSVFKLQVQVDSIFKFVFKLQVQINSNFKSVSKLQVQVDSIFKSIFKLQVQVDSVFKSVFKLQVCKSAQSSSIFKFHLQDYANWLHLQASSSPFASIFTSSRSSLGFKYPSQVHLQASSVKFSSIFKFHL
ncbi:hypothetical protein C2S51_007383 [Perilla frutescens var. frutescens]|nr:hypothetical protein C2S51_007383 [Perilla frutescens var. frutescens]